VFAKILIANRGEIACRIERTAARLGVRTIAVYSDADAGARHVLEAGEAIRIGPAPPLESYLRIDRIVEAARATGAEAIHPGYGFLAENAAFAEACASAGLVFIGPPPAAIRAMGSKSAAKALMHSAGVPIVPGYHGGDQAPATLEREAAAIGFPVLLKPVAGGGGKGMRIVPAAGEFRAALEAARREAAGAFGDDRMLIERCLARPRHIEIQIFCDARGNAVHLFERDCSIQRRHQKIIEEAPAPGLDEARRSAMGEAALAAARAVGYIGAGTVEFLVDTGGAFYFMEMNTRLQVEHPVTEEVTGQDLVEWQLRIAAGEPLPLDQARLRLDGHAIEVRLYAEDPARDFLPSTGRLLRLGFPAASVNVRIETGLRTGDTVTIHYDPMIAKLIVRDRDRAGAVRRLRDALREVRIAGLTTNVSFLASIAAHPAFADGACDTGFLDRADLAPASPPAVDAEVVALASLATLLGRRDAAERARRASADPGSPWHGDDAWRLNAAPAERLRFLDEGREIEVTAVARDRGWRLEVSGAMFEASGTLGDGGALFADLDGHRLRAAVVREGLQLVVFRDGTSCRLALPDAFAVAADAAALAGALTAPMPGRVVSVRVRAGDWVARGAPLLILEAMKMEHTLTAPAAGTVQSLRCAVDDVVEAGAELLLLAPD
jgi:3-methylcrotonyl-CoA carboxylase alpha subunit